MKIAIGSDHAAIDLRKTIVQHLQSKKIDVLDAGTHSQESTHYPIYAQIVAKAVVAKQADFGILICGTGIGIGISANKVNGIRAATVSDTYSARMARAHNNANIPISWHWAPGSWALVWHWTSWMPGWNRSIKAEDIRSGLTSSINLKQGKISQIRPAKITSKNPSRDYVVLVKSLFVVNWVVQRVNTPNITYYLSAEPFLASS